MVNKNYYENLVNLKKLKGNTHPFHIVDQSPWPLLTAVSVFNLLLCAMLYMHSRTFVVEGGSTFKFLVILLLALSGCLYCLIGWLNDVKGEACYEGHHTLDVAKGLRIGIVLFIVSEAMFFVAFFWALLHSALVPSVEIGSVWPPMGMPVFHAGGVPLMNTFVLLLSGSFITSAHHAIVNRLGDHAVYLMLIGILWGVIFELWQFQEYENSWFSMNDGIFGSVFFMITGFHGFHVMLGLCGLIYTWLRLRRGEISSEHHVGFEGAAWYWHFVDVVWLIVFWLIYWWGMTATYAW